MTHQGFDLTDKNGNQIVLAQSDPTEIMRLTAAELIFTNCDVRLTGYVPTSEQDD
ncbi:MAG: hypothetical protein ACFCU8_13720 [Thermosynechococcaceae cyanobacterium]